MMRLILCNLYRLPFSTMIGVFFGALLMLWAPGFVGLVTDAYDQFSPVLTMKGRLVQIEGDAVQVHITGTKHRGYECQFIRIYGYSVDKSGFLSNAVATRLDSEFTAYTRPAGKYDIGVWSIRPIAPDAVSVWVYTDHSCVGRLIKTRVAEVSLKK